MKSSSSTHSDRVQTVLAWHLRVVGFYSLIILLSGCVSADRMTARRADIEARVSALGYSCETAGTLADMVSSWPLGESKETASSQAILAKRIIGVIRDRIAADQATFDLTEVTKSHRANCLGYTQLFVVLGGRAGLFVTPVSVRELQKAGSPPNGIRHVCCLVTLSDRTTVMVNPAPPAFVSRPFVLEATYTSSGNYLQLRSQNNPVGLYRKIQILNEQGLIAQVHNSRGALLAAQNRFREACEQYAEAVGLNPQFAEAWNNQAIALRRLGDAEGALSSYNRAIEIDGDYAEAYYNRAVCYASLGERTTAQQDLQVAAQLNPALATPGK